MPENATPAYITSLISHFEDLRDGTHGGLRESQRQGSPFREGGGTAGSSRPTGSHRNEHQLAARHRATHRNGTTTHTRRRVDRVMDLELA